MLSYANCKVSVEFVLPRHKMQTVLLTGKRGKAALMGLDETKRY